MNDSVRAIVWQDNHLRLLDQRRLPESLVWNDYFDLESVAEAIKDMVVRGAPAIGIAAAYACVMAVRQHFTKDPEGWKENIQATLDHLAQARPTAVNLHWAIERIRALIETCDNKNPVKTVLAEAEKIHKEDIQANHTMGKLGSALIEEGQSVLTHCNTGSLATGGFGTALGVIRQAWKDGKLKNVFADETRPWLQGSRLTAWELTTDQIPVRLLADSAAPLLMAHEEVQWVIVGADRITAKGDVANKIGTYGLALAAKKHGVKFMVVAPSSTVDMALKNGRDIPIEFRGSEELLEVAGSSYQHADVGAWNPVFDVTPASLIDYIVTEKGVVEKPTLAKMKSLMNSVS